MSILEHPPVGTLLICDFDSGFKEPEMVKQRVVVVVSPKIEARRGLCTVVALSMTDPDPVMPYHRQIDIRPQLPVRWSSDGVWIKGDMINTVAFHRLDLIRIGKDRRGKRLYYYDPLSSENLRTVRECFLRSLALGSLTKQL